MVCPFGSVTAADRSDGFGAQYSAMISVYAWSVMMNMTYCHTPWKQMAHGVNASKMFSFVGGHLYGDRANNSKSVNVEPTHAVIKGKYRYFPKIAKDVGNHYFTSPKPRLEWNSSETNLAVHIRRGDVNERNKNRWTEPSAIARCIGLIQKRHGPCRLHIFTEGSAGLEYLLPFNPTFYIDTDVQTAFHHMVMADILVIAKSSFTWAAAFLSNATIYAPHRFNHRINRC